MTKSANSKTIRILVTGIGAPGTSGTLHMLEQGARTSGIELMFFGTETRGGYVGQKSIQETFFLPRPQEPGYLTKLSGIIQSKAIDLVIPQTTNESEYLSQYSSELACKVSVLMYADLKTLNNKGLLMEAFDKAGLPSPAHYWVESGSEFMAAAAKLDYPKKDVVLKLPSSSGMRGVRRISESQETLEEFVNNKPNGWSLNQEALLSMLGEGKWPKMVATSFLIGAEYSVDVWRREGVSIVLPRIRKVIRSGISMETELELNPQIISSVEKFLDHYEIEGLLGFQFIMEDGSPKILECNPRVQGTMVASLLSGVNILWLEVKWQLGLPFSPEEFQVTHQTGQFRRTWAGELIYPDGNIEPIQS